MQLRKLSLLLLIQTAILVPAAGFAQSNTDAQKTPATKLEAFSTKTGVALIKGYTTAGKISALGSISVDARELRYAGGQSWQQGISITVTESGRLQNSNISYIDIDEIDSLVQGIDYISKIGNNATSLENFEAVYRTKGDLAITTFSTKSGTINAAVSSGYIGKTTAFLSMTELLTLKTLVEEAKKLLPNVAHK